MQQVMTFPGRFGYEVRHLCFQLWETRLGRIFKRLLEDRVMSVALLLRLSVGWIFLWAGFDKLFGDWTAAGFLTNATSGPMYSWWVSMGESDTAVSVIDPLVIWGADTHWLRPVLWRGHPIRSVLGWIDDVPLLPGAVPAGA